MSRPGSGAAWASLATGLASAVTLPLAVYATRFSESYELLHAGFVIPVGAVLAFASLSLARRSERRDSISLAGARPAGAARIGRVLAVLGLCLAAAGLVALAVYGLLEYVGSRD